jgi:hypothetical protein
VSDCPQILRGSWVYIAGGSRGLALLLTCWGW